MLKTLHVALVALVALVMNPRLILHIQASCLLVVVAMQ